MKARLGVLAGLLAVAACTTATKNEPPRTAPLPAPPPVASASATPPAAPEGDLASKESKLVAKTLVRVSDLRGLKATKPVPGVKLERTALVGRVKEKALREYPADALRREGQLLQELGFAPTSFDYIGEMMTLLEAQLEGFYEPNNGTMYLAAELKGKEAEATLAHELVHALQDQNYDLRSRSKYQPGKGDETLALACLAEGDATSLMMDYMLAGENRTALDLPDDMLRELMASGANSENIKNVPHILRTTLIAPYLDGVMFVDNLRRRGGWASVDQAWRRVPVSTEQVLHVEKWEKNEAPIAIAAPAAAALGPDWKRDDEDTFGELGFALTYEEWLTPADARSAANGWGGDRSSTWVKGDELAFAVHTRYDEASVVAGKTTHKDDLARNGFMKLAAGMKRKIQPKPAVDKSDELCFERPDLGPLLVIRKDRELVIIAGPAANKGKAWTSTSTCATAKKWADEILSSK